SGGPECRRVANSRTEDLELGRKKSSYPRRTCSCQRTALRSGCATAYSAHEIIAATASRGHWSFIHDGPSLVFAVCIRADRNRNVLAGKFERGVSTVSGGRVDVFACV